VLTTETDLDKLSNDLNYLNHRPLYAKSNGHLVLTTSFADVPGCTVTIDQDGYYEIEIVFDMEYTGGSGDDNELLYGTCQGPGPTDFGEWAVFKAVEPNRATVSQLWRLSLSNGDVLKARGKKSGGSGGSRVAGAFGYTTIMATLVAS
jgi:hypothetical protein